MFSYSAMLDLMVNRVDLFGKPVALNFNGRDKSKSFIGAIFSFIVFGFVVWAAYFYSQDMFKKRNPKTITSQGFSENPDEIIIEPDTFAFGFGVQHPETFAHYLDDRIYTVVVDHVQLRRETNSDGSVNELWSTTTLETEPCTTDHYGKLGHKFVDIELNKLICIKKEQSALEEIRIQGVFESPIYEYIRGSIKACDNSTTTNPAKCVTPDELTYYLGGGFFAMYFTNIAIDPKNYTDPSIKYRDSIFTSTTFPYYKEVTAWLNHLKMKSDVGWLVEEENNLGFVSFEKTVENLNFRQDMGSVLNLVVRVGKITTYYERSYTKISEILAEVNGLTAAVFIAAAIILYPYSNIKFYESLINDLFDITMLKKQQEHAEAEGNKELKQANSKMGKTLERQATQMRRSPTMSPIQIPSPTLSVPKKGQIHIDMSEIDLSKSIQPSPRDVSPNETKKQQVLVNDKAIQRKNKKSSSVIQKTKKLSFAPKLSSPSSITGLDDRVGDSERQNFDKSGSFYERELPKSSLRLTNLLFPPRGDDSSQFDISSHQASFHQEQTKSPKPTRKMLDRYETGSPSEMNLALENLIMEQTEKNQAHPRKGSIRKSARFTTRKFEKILEQVADNESMNEADNSVDEAFSPNTREGMRRAEVKQRATKLTNKLHRDSDRINITFWEYVRSYFWRNDSIKEKFRLLNEGIRRIEERLDIFNVFKKFREVDKMKLLLLEHEQLVLFDSLPKPELAINPDQPVDPKTSKSISHLRETRFISEKRRNDLIMLSYENSKNKYDKTLIDERLLQIYDDIIDY